MHSWVLLIVEFESDAAWRSASLPSMRSSILVELRHFADFSVRRKSALRPSDFKSLAAGRWNLVASYAINGAVSGSSRRKPMAEERVVCRTPSAGRTGTTRIPKWKFDAVREAILRVLADGVVPFSELTERAGAMLADDDQARLGSIGWHVTTVKLELEVRGEIRRLDRPGKQVLALASPD